MERYHMEAMEAMEAVETLRRTDELTEAEDISEPIQIDIGFNQETLSREVQNKLFTLGCNWADGIKGEPKNLHKPILAVINKVIYYRDTFSGVQQGQRAVRCNIINPHEFLGNFYNTKYQDLLVFNKCNDVIRWHLERKLSVECVDSSGDRGYVKSFNGDKILAYKVYNKVALSIDARPLPNTLETVTIYRGSTEIVHWLSEHAKELKGIWFWQHNKEVATLEESDIPNLAYSTALDNPLLPFGSLPKSLTKERPVVTERVEREEEDEL
jgi:hypothetical protein